MVIKQEIIKLEKNLNFVLKKLVALKLNHQIDYTIVSIRLTSALKAGVQ